MTLAGGNGSGSDHDERLPAVFEEATRAIGFLQTVAAAVPWRTRFCLDGAPAVAQSAPAPLARSQPR